MVSYIDHNSWFPTALAGAGHGAGRRILNQNDFEETADCLYLEIILVTVLLVAGVDISAVSSVHAGIAAAAGCPAP